LLSKDGKQIYVATTYFERITRGKRSDVIEVWDNEKLSFVREIKIPAKRAGALNYDGIFRQTENGHFILVQNATPATSVSVVDMRKNVFISEITATAGCWSIIPVPGKPQSFTTICGDGTLLTITLGDDGKVASQSRSKPMFSVNDDPIFITPGRLRDALVFVSFHGNVYTARSQNNDSMKFEPVWSLLDDADRAQRWLPGGYNLLAVEPKSERLYILMHRNGTEGSHKNPADEIWVYDLKTRKRVARVPGKSALSMSIVQGNNPQLLTIDGTKVRVFDISEPEPREILTIPEAAEASLQVMGYMGGKGGNE
jgi:aralkylamine dehydrogenase heavy chain/methylamine dehydrogenase heavy chain